MFGYVPIQPNTLENLSNAEQLGIVAVMLLGFIAIRFIRRLRSSRN